MSHQLHGKRLIDLPSWSTIDPDGEFVDGVTSRRFEEVEEGTRTIDGGVGSLNGKGTRVEFAKRNVDVGHGSDQVG